jgi:hypothetical protein
MWRISCCSAIGDNDMGPRGSSLESTIGAEASSFRPQEVRDLTCWSRPRNKIRVLTFRSVRQCVILSTSCSFVCLSSLSLYRYTEIWSALSLAAAESHVNYCFPFGHARRSFHSTMLPNLQVPVYCALTIFETGISPWMHPSEWLEANTKHIRSIFNGIVDLTESYGKPNERVML